jgi:type I restriction enzyme S subunit
VRLITAKNVKKSFISISPEEFLSERDYQAWMTRGLPMTGDILFTTEAPMGNASVVRIPERFALAQRVICFRPYSAVNPDFLTLQLLSEPFQAILNLTATGLTAKGIKAAKLKRLPVAVPPLAEQQRIVAKVDELMALCDQLDAARTERERRRTVLASAALHHLSDVADAKSIREHAAFYLRHLPRLTSRVEHIHELRQMILEIAVRGRLVPQDSSEEPGSELLRRIQAENNRSEGEGPRKKNAELPAIDLGTAPFELPVGWIWARFPELGVFGRGKSKYRPRNDPSLFDGGTHLLIQTGDVARSNGVIATYTNKYNEFGLAQSLKWPKGTLCITIAANIADSGILEFDACFPDSVVGFIPASVFPNARYFEYFIRTAKANLLEFAPATAQKNINLEILNAVLIPLPPLAEQGRIVEKVDKIMVLCDRLEEQLACTQSESSHFLDSVLHEALQENQVLGSLASPNGDRRRVAILRSR